MPARKSLSLAHAFRCDLCRLHRGPGMGEELCRYEERKKTEQTPRNVNEGEGVASAPPAPKQGRGRPRKNEAPTTPRSIINNDEGDTIVVSSSLSQQLSASQPADGSPLQHRSTGELRGSMGGLLTPRQTQETSSSTARGMSPSIAASPLSQQRGDSEPAETSRPLQQRSIGNFLGLATPRRKHDAYAPFPRLLGASASSSINDTAGGAIQNFSTPADNEAGPSAPENRRNSADAPEVVPSTQPTDASDHRSNNGPSQKDAAKEFESSAAQAERLKARNQVQEAAAEQAYRLHEQRRKTNRRLCQILSMIVFFIVVYLFWCWYNAANFQYIRKRRGDVFRE